MIDSARTAAQPQPGLVLLLADAVAGSSGAAFKQALQARLGGSPAVEILDQPQLRELSLPGARSQRLARAQFERAIGARVARCLAAAVGERLGRSRLVILVVAILGEDAGRRLSISLLPYLHGALQRVALPPTIEPVLVGVHLLPDRWRPLEGAALFAWFKDFWYHVLGDGEHGRSADGKVRGYGISVVIGRSNVALPAGGTALNLSDEQLGAVAAEFAAAAFCSRSLDWILAANRGRHDAQGTFVSVGIAPVSGATPRERASRESGVLWPVLPPRERAVLRGAALGGETPEGWDTIELLRAPPGCEGWLLNLATGLDVVDLVGTEAWRLYYRALSNQEQEELHPVPGGSHRPDPFSARALPPEEPESDADALVL